MVDRQRRITLLHLRNGAERYHAAVTAGQANGVQRRQTRRCRRIMLQHHAVLVGLGIDSGDQPLAEGVVEGVIHVGHRNTQSAGAVPVNVHVGSQPLVLPVAADVGQLRQGLKLVHQLWHPGAQRLKGRGLEGKLVLSAADGGVDGQILGRLEIERHARHVCHRLL